MRSKKKPAQILTPLGLSFLYFWTTSKTWFI